MVDLPPSLPAESILLPLPRIGRRREPAAPMPPPPAGAVSLEQVSSLLWNGLGFSRHVHGRAALPRRGRPALTVFALLPQGAYRYDAEEHRLDPVSASDLRACIDAPGKRAAALHLLYVTGDASHGDEAWEECGRLALEDVDRVAQHVGARCEEQGLVAATTRHVPQKVRKALHLGDAEHVALAQRIDQPAQAAF